MMTASQLQTMNESIAEILRSLFSIHSFSMLYDVPVGAYIYIQQAGVFEYPPYLGARWECEGLGVE